LATKNTGHDEELKKSHQKNMNLFENEVVGMYRSNLDGSALLEANKALCNILGYTREELLFKPFTIHWADPKAREEMVKQLIKDGYILKYEADFVTKGGEIVHNLLSLKLYPQDGYIEGFAIDLTERKRAEEALRKSEARFRDLTENSTDWIWEVDNQMCCIYASPKIKDVLGYSPEEVIGKMTVDFLPSEESERIPANWEDLKHNPKPWRNLEYRAIHKDGSLRVLESNALPMFDADGQFIGYRGIDRDVTKRKHTEYLLEMSQKKFAAAFYDSPAPMVITEAESGKTIDVNNAGVLWTGYSHDETIGLTGAELGFISAIERSQYIREIFDKGFIDSWELKFRTREGNIRDILLSARRIEINNKPCILSHLHDITDQRRAEEELKKYRDHLEVLVQDRTEELNKSNIELKHEIEIRKTTEVSLRSRELELGKGREDLEEMNAALRILLKQRENDKINLEDNIISNIKVSVMPYVERLDAISLNEDEKHCLSMIKSRLKEIASPFIKKLSSQFLSLTPSEIQIASMIREGKRSKNIAEIMNISLNTVHSYRYNIRIKTGLKNNKVNLRSYLQTLD
jgi:PAS domain S-box-containing protein